VLDFKRKLMESGRYIKQTEKMNILVYCDDYELKESI